jgi:site-specific recombinase XerD
MAGKAKAPTVTWDATNKRWRSRFSHDKKRWEFTNSHIEERDVAGAHKWLATCVSDVVAGRYQRHVNGTDPAARLSAAAGKYLEQVTGGEITDKTAGMRKIHFRKHLVPAFRKLSDINQASLATYQANRLKSVRYETVKKELSSLRQVLLFAKEQGWIADVAPFPKRPKKSQGTNHRLGNKGHTPGVTAETVRALIPHLPEFSRRSRIDGVQWPIRALVEVMYETGLRVGFWREFKVGVHWRKGWRHLHITEASDKNRWRRDVPLSDRAVEILEATPVQKDGQMFAVRDFRESIRGAALKVMPAEVAKSFHLHDIRHARTTELLELTGDLPGVGFLVGHKQVTTTNRYAHQNAKSAATVMARVNLGQKDSGTDSGTEPEKRNADPETGSAFSAVSTLCEGEDSNLHGSYPASTSSGLGSKKAAKSRRVRGTEGAEGTPKRAHVGTKTQDAKAVTGNSGTASKKGGDQ